MEMKSKVFSNRKSQYCPSGIEERILNKVISI